MLITDDLQKLLDILPQEIRQKLEHHPQRDGLIEVVMDLGRRPEARFRNKAEYLSETTVTHEQLNGCIAQVSSFGGDNRAGIEQTLHRISAIRNRTGEIIGLTCRVGRAVEGTIQLIHDLVEKGQSILMLGRPGVGKTTALREIARVLADELHKRVVIIDTSNEIAGDGDVPHPAIGRARRMQVARPDLQHQVMIEAVENHMPEVIVIDEIGTELEALAARTIAERGVQLVGTAHGNQLENLIKNPTLSDLVGGIQSVTLGDEEARRRRCQKTVLERKASPTFKIAVEMAERQRWGVHESVAETVDSLLRGQQPGLQVRAVTDDGQVTITHQVATRPSRKRAVTATQTLTTRPTVSQQGTGRILPFSQVPNQNTVPEEREQQRVLDEPTEQNQHFNNVSQQGISKDQVPLHIYPYGVSRHQLEQVIQRLNLPVVLTRDIDHAHGVVALSCHAKDQSRLQHVAKSHQVPIHLMETNTISEITRTLRQLLDMQEASTNDELEKLFDQKGHEDELEALEEARLAMEQVVLSRKQPVELLPRSAKVRKMQHELVEHYHLQANSFGEDPNRRLRIYPA
jgi:stage III sporulation protein SpoIIIAA